MPAGPVDVRAGFRASSCTDPLRGDGNNKCFLGRANGADVPWEADETNCWPIDFVARDADRVPKCFGGVCLQCEPGYPDDADDRKRGCFDAYGRIYQWTGGAWEEQRLLHIGRTFSGWPLGICPARGPKTCEPTPSPSVPPSPGASCSLPPMPECGSVGNVDPDIGLFGCCVTDKHPNFPRDGRGRPLPSPFDDAVEAAQAAEEREQTVPRDRDGRVDEAEYVNEIVRRLRARGLCATRGGPGDEVGLKASNGESFQIDVHLGNGRPRRGGYVSFCRPARF